MNSIPNNLILIGGGGHAGVVYDCIEKINQIYTKFNILGYVDDVGNLDLHSKILRINYNSSPYLGPITILNELYKKNKFKLFCCIGDNHIRQMIVERVNILLNINVENIWIDALIHPTATIGLGVKIGLGSIICTSAVVNVGTIIGDHTIINTSASIDHDCVIGSYVHIAPGCSLCGTIEIGKGTLIGVGTKCIPKIKIGSDTIIGAGSVILKDVESNQKLYGLITKNKKEKYKNNLLDIVNFNNSIKTNSELTGRLSWLSNKIIKWSRVEELLIQSQINNHFSNNGPCVRALELYLRKILMIDSNKSIILVNNGSSALHAIKSTIEIYNNNKKELKFATQAFTFPASAQGSLSNSLIIDVDEDGGLSLDLVNKYLNEIDGIIITNSFGHLTNLSKYQEWSDLNKKYLIYDNAACSYSFYKNKNSLNYGTASTISFHHTKPCGFGEGGAIIIDSIYEHSLRKGINFGYDVVKQNVEWLPNGNNYKMSDIQAAFIYSYLHDLDDIIKHHKTIHLTISREIESNNELNTNVYLFPNYSDLQPFTSCIPICFAKKIIISENLVKHINIVELIDVRKYYKPLQNRTESPKAWEFYDSIICFPCHSDMKREDIQKIIKICIKIIKKEYVI